MLSQSHQCHTQHQSIHKEKPPSQQQAQLKILLLKTQASILPNAKERSLPEDEHLKCVGSWDSPPGKGWMLQQSSPEPFRLPFSSGSEARLADAPSTPASTPWLICLLCCEASHLSDKCPCISFLRAENFTQLPQNHNLAKLVHAADPDPSVAQSDVLIPSCLTLHGPIRPGSSLGEHLQHSLPTRPWQQVAESSP